MAFNVTQSADLPEFGGLEQALTGQSQRAFSDPGGTVDLLRQQYAASGLGSSGILQGGIQKAESQRQMGLAEQLAQLRVQRAMAQLEQRRFADQLGFQDYQGGLNRQFQSQENAMGFERQSNFQREMMQAQRAYEEEQQSNNLLGTLLGGGLSFLTGGLGGLDEGAAEIVFNLSARRISMRAGMKKKVVH